MALVIWETISTSQEGTIPRFFRGRSNLQSATEPGQFDIYNLVNSDVRSRIGSGWLTWSFMVSWNVQVNVTTQDLSSVKQFGGFETRYKLGLIQYGLTNGIVDDCVWRYRRQLSKKKAFFLNSANTRQTMNDVANPTVPITQADYMNVADWGVLPFDPFLINSYRGEPLRTATELQASDRIMFFNEAAFSYQYVVFYEGVSAIYWNTSSVGSDRI